MTLEEFVFNIPLYHKVDASNGYNDIIEVLERMKKVKKFELPAMRDISVLSTKDTFRF